MSVRKPSAETENRNLKRELRQVHSYITDLRAQTRKLVSDVKSVGNLLLEAEKELSEWKSRFDLLLEKMGKAGE